MKKELPPGTRIQYVHLRVKSLSRVRIFYEDVLGFHAGMDDRETVALSSTGQRPFQIVLTEDRGAAPRPPRSVGLFHVAFRYPDRVALGAALLRILQRGYPLHGASDHAVSEALYLADPEGNGIELYADRPRELWQWRDGEIQMVTEPLDVEGLLKAASSPARAMHPQTEIGHVHLSVSSLPKAEEFYAGVLGFTVTTRSYPGALFFAAGGYHHHIGANVWYTRNGSPAPSNAVGLVRFGIAVPESGWNELNEHSFHALPQQKERDSLRLRDPDGIEVELMATTE